MTNATARQGKEGVMSWTPEERRKMPDPSLMAMQLDTMQADIGEVKKSVNTLIDAVARMSLIEERQANNQTDTNRAFDKVEKLERVLFEKYEKLDSRVHALEVSVPVVTAQSANSTKWINLALSAFVGALFMFIAHQIGFLA